MKNATIKIISIALVLLTFFSMFAINASAASSYNVNKAVKYARQYTDSSGKMNGKYNSSEYNVYKYPNPRAYLGYDCTNFVSQCLYAGGVTASNSWRPVKRGQDYRNIKGGTAWVSANELFKVLQSRNYHCETVKNDLSNIHKGDAVFMDFDNDKKMDHATICTGKSSNNKPYYCAHSSWRKDYEYSTSQWSDGKAYVVHMSNCKKQTVTTTKAPAPTLKSYTITSSSGVAVRKNAGTSYSKVGGVSKGSKIFFSKTKTKNGYTWALIENGSYKNGTWGKTTGYWIALI